MKIRQGFVSNSSSSSFVCDICKEEFIGQDLSLSDVDHRQCENGHIICDEAILENPGLKDDDGEEIELGRYDEIPKEMCPICQFREITYTDVVSYLFRKCNQSIDEVEEEIKNKFSSYKDFKQYIKI